MNKTVFFCKDCEFYKLFKRYGDYPYCSKYQKFVTTYDPPCEEFKLRKKEEGCPNTQRNMYDCLPCPKCDSKYRYPMRDKTIRCDDCGFREPWDEYITERYGDLQPLNFGQPK